MKAFRFESISVKSCFDKFFNKHYFLEPSLRQNILAIVWRSFYYLCLFEIVNAYNIFLSYWSIFFKQQRF